MRLPERYFFSYLSLLSSFLRCLVNLRLFRRYFLLASLLIGWLSLSGCSGLGLSKADYQQENNLNNLSAGQALASYQHYNSASGLNQLLKEPNAADWRAWQVPELPEYDLWDRLRESFQMDISSNDPRVQAEINWILKHPRYLDRVTQRASRYMYHVLEEVEKRNLPGELALLPIVESAYDPFAYSHGRASGMWQFIPGTAKELGLANNWWYDGRRDIQASTRAALTYLTQLHQRFNDWHLALASYNTGGGNVNRARTRNLEAGGTGTFWELKLHRETSAYVPKMVALARLIAEPEKYGLNLTSIKNEPYFTQVATNGQLDLALAADLADISLEELYLLNPGFSQWATSPTGPHHLLLPVDNAPIFAENIKKLPVNQRMRWQRHQVKSGESLLSLSKRFATTPDMIRSANQLKGNIIRVGQPLLIPIPSQQASHYSLSANQRLERQQNLTRTGTKIDYKVQKGDSFWLIARKHQVGIRQLAAWNNMAPGDPLVPGKQLVIWSQASKPQPAMGISQRTLVRKVNYTVRSGDSLSSIASRFKVSVKDIVRWNNLNTKKHLQPKQRLTLHIDVTRN